MFYKTKHPLSAFTLIELAIVLAVVGVLFIGLWRLLSGGSQQLRDQAAANSQQQLISAVSSFLGSAAGQNYLIGNTSGACTGAVTNAPNKQCGPNTKFPLPLPPAGASPDGGANVACKASYGGSNAAGFCDYLPINFSAASVNSYGQGFNIQVLRDNTPAGTAPTTYSFMILTSGGTPIPDVSGARIVSVIGGDGGFIYQNPAGVCGAATFSCGAYGAWSLDPVGTYGFAVGLDLGGTAAGGQIATRTYYTPGQNGTYPWLARQLFPGDTTYQYNTMTADLFMGANTANQHPPSPAAPNGSISQISFSPLTADQISAGLTPGKISMGMGTVDLQGGILTSTGVGQEDGNTGSNLSINLVSTGNATGGNLINAVQPCSVVQYVGSGLHPGKDVNGADCDFAINASSITTPNGTMEALNFYAGTFLYQGSDIRLKKNIRPLDNSLDKIMQINPVAFTYKANGKEGIGVIAQELEKIYPELVTGDDKSMRYVSYEGLVGPLVGAVQELKKQNDDLRHQLEIQKARQNKFEEDMKSRATP